MQPLLDHKACLRRHCACIWTYAYVDNDREKETEKEINPNDVQHFIQIYRTDDLRDYYAFTSDGAFIYNNIYKYEIRPLNNYSDDLIDKDIDHFSKVVIHYNSNSDKHNTFEVSLYGNASDYINGQHPFIHFLMYAMFV